MKVCNSFDLRQSKILVCITLEVIEVITNSSEVIWEVDISLIYKRDILKWHRTSGNFQSI